jgi:NAD+ synthetase
VLGYPPRDLVENRSVVERNLLALHDLARETPLPALVGFVARNDTGRGLPIHNSVALLCAGRVEAVRHKRLLPTYDVFDEDRYFEPGPASEPVVLNGRRLGITICEDAWRPATPRHKADPVAELCAAGADILINVSASPFTQGKRQVRLDLFGGHAARHRRPLLMVNQVGGNDELVFDGGSMVFDGQGRLVAEGPLFEESLIVVDVDRMPPPVAPAATCDEEQVFRALVLGIRDYLHKCGFQKAVLGLSGGIDSALTAVLAVEALGPRNVLGVSMPSRFSSQHSCDDARRLAENLAMPYRVIPIEPAHQALLDMLQPAFAGLPADITEENLQARIRGVTLMALSNKFGMLLLTTGNKSELGVGYATLYGDMCGGLAPINDLPKTMVYALARHVNRHREVIPASSITKAPSAELRPNQTDQDTLPPYDLLDRVLQEYVENGKDADEICRMGLEPAVVRRTVRLIETSEYKRRQACPGLKVTSKAFGYGRRIPVAKRIEP